MATKSRKKQYPTDDDGQPDIYEMTHDTDMTVYEAAEAVGLSALAAHLLLYKQEVAHEPELRIRIKDRAKLAARIAKERDEKRVRWERLMARTGLSKAELMELYTEATGKEAKRLRGGDEEDEDEPKGKSKKPARKSKAKSAPVDDDEDDEDEDDEDEDEDDDDEDEDEEPAPAKSKARRGRGRK